MLKLAGTTLEGEQIEFLITHIVLCNKDFTMLYDKSVLTESIKPVEELPSPTELVPVVYLLDEWKDTIEVRLERVNQMDGSYLWAIRERGCCLNHEKQWEIEPMQSSRDSEFFKRCRWDNKEDAIVFWKSGCVSRFEYYRKYSNITKEDKE